MRRQKDAGPAAGSLLSSSSGKGGAVVLGGRSAFKQVIAENRTRQLQVASKGRYKYYLVSKIINFLKTEFLEAREKRPTLSQLLDLVNEPHVSDVVKQWLMDEGLSKHPRVRFVLGRGGQGEPRIAYEPPLRNCSSEAAVYKLLKTKYNSGEGGLLRSVIEDSVPIADRFIKNLLSENKIIEIPNLEKGQILFYNNTDPKLDKCVADSRFVDLWRKVDVSNKEMSHIKTYLKNKKLPVFDDEEFERLEAEKKRKLEEEKAAAATAAKKLKRQGTRSSRRLKDNAHLKEKLVPYDETM